MFSAVKKNIHLPLTFFFHVPHRGAFSDDGPKKENRPVPKNRPAEPFDAQRAIVGWMIYIRTSSNSEEKLKLGTEHPLVAGVGGLPTSAGFVARKD